MTLRLPLFGKILGWFFLNLLLLALIAGWVVRSEFRLEALINGAGGERFQRVADTLLGELRERPRNTWDRTLERFSTTYQVQFAVVDERGEVVAGAALTLPEEIKSRVRIGRGPGRPEGARGNGPQREEFRGAPPEGFRGPPPDIERRAAGGLPRTLLQTHDPDRFWVLFPAPQLEFGPRRLVAQAETLSAGGLLVDFRPLFWAAGAVLVVSVLWWLPFVHGITRSLRQMTQATEQISVGRFDTRVDGGRGDELGRLGLAIQSMAVRLEHHLTGQKRFLSDISHELCAPIARLQMALGILEQRADNAQQQQLADLREELDHMSALVNELLSFSKAGLKSRDLALGPVLLRLLIERVLAREGVEGQEFRLDVDARENCAGRARTAGPRPGQPGSQFPALRRHRRADHRQHGARKRTGHPYGRGRRPRGAARSAPAIGRTVLPPRRRPDPRARRHGLGPGHREDLPRGVSGNPHAAQPQSARIRRRGAFAAGEPGVTGYR